MIVEVEVRTVYGVRAVYPVNREARIFAMIAGTKTLTPAVLSDIKLLGVEVKQVFPNPLEIA